MSDSPQIDVAALFKALRHCKGNRKQALAVLEASGIHLTEYQLGELIDAHTYLKAYFGADSPVVFDDTLPEIETLNRPAHALANLSEAEKEHHLALQTQVQDELLAAQGLAGVGLTAQQIARYKSFEIFAGHSFRNSLDAAHGFLIVTLVQLSERAADIVQNILNNEEEESRVLDVYQGAIIEHMGPKYSPAEKLKWQEQHTLLIDQIRKISDSAQKAAETRLKIEELKLKAKEASGQSKPKPVREVK